MPQHRNRAVWLLVACGMSLPSAPIAAEEAASTESATVKKSKDNLHFNLPPDWPIERRGGITAPIPIEEYLAKKFKELESKLNDMDQRLNGLDLRLRIIEEDAKKRRQEQPQ